MPAPLALRIGLPFAVFIAAVALAAMYHPFDLMEGGDSALYDYMSQCIVRGQLPYRDAIDGKAPGSLYLSALAMVIGKAFGVDTVNSVRALFVLLVGVLSVVIYLVTEAYLQNRIAAVLACLIPLLAPELVVMMISGTRPKVPMIICGMLTLLLIARERPFWAGFCSMLAYLFWQPGLMFTGTALLIFSRYLTSWRDRRALKVLLGAAVPLAVMLIYFAARGALADLWRWTITYNYAVYFPEGREPVSVALQRLWFLIKQVTDGQMVWVKLSIIGLVGYAAQCVIARVKKSSPDTSGYKEALLMPPVIFFGFCIINYPGADGLIVLLPFVGIFAAFVFAAMYQALTDWSFIKRRVALAHLTVVVLAVPLAVIGFNAIKRARSFHIEEGRTLSDQRREFQQIAERLGPNDRMYVHGALEILVLLNRPNLNPYVFLDRGKDRFLSTYIEGGFDTVLAEMKSAAPRIIALTRLQNVTYRDALLDWAASQYERLPLDFAHNAVYVIKATKATTEDASSR
ncbi:MAG: hypothetical protein ACJ74J_23695 [Blastocatellia bacterium]